MLGVNQFPAAQDMPGRAIDGVTADTSSLGRTRLPSDSH